MTLDEWVSEITNDPDHERRDRRIRAIEALPYDDRKHSSLLARCCESGAGPFLAAVCEAMHGPPG